MTSASSSAAFYMFCSRHNIQLWLITMLSSLIARRWVGTLLNLFQMVYGRAHRGPVCGFLVVWLPFALFHHRVLFYCYISFNCYYIIFIDVSQIRYRGHLRGWNVYFCNVELCQKLRVRNRAS